MKAEDLITILQEYKPSTQVNIYIMEKDKIEIHGFMVGEGMDRGDSKQLKTILLVVDKNNSAPIEMNDN